MLEDLAVSIADAMENSEDFENLKIGDVNLRAAAIDHPAYASFKITDTDGDVYVVRVTRAS